MRILIILLFVSFSGFSQSYKEVMSIKDIDSFKKVFIENNFELMTPQRLIELSKEEGEELNEDTVKLWMEEVTMYTRDNASQRGVYYKSDETFSLQITRKNWVGMEIDNAYDDLLEDVKNKCKYVKIVTSPSGNDYVTYSCAESLFKGNIGFRIEGDEGIIWNFPKE